MFVELKMFVEFLKQLKMFMFNKYSAHSTNPSNDDV